MIKNIIDELKSLGWVFTFIGANIDVEKVAATISISNYIGFSQTRKGTTAMFAQESKARMNMYDKISKGVSKKEMAEGYFDE